MAHRPQRLTGRQIRAAALVGVLLALAGAGTLFILRARSAGAPKLQTMVLSARPFVSTVDVVGTIAPGRAIPIVAPYDGSVTMVGFTFGDPVAAGQVLLRMDDADARQKEREARSTVLKAELDDEAMAAWDTSPDVSRARRAKTAADRDVADSQRKLTETKTLLDRGLVARSEYDAEQQQLRTHEAAAAAAAEDLKVALKRGVGANRTIARLAVASAHARLREIEDQLSESVLKAAQAGVVIRPQGAKPDDAELHPGQRVARGQWLGSIAQPDALAVDVSVSEVDASRIVVGQPVMVTGGGLGSRQLRGAVTNIAGEARPAEQGGSGASVRVRITLQPPDGEGPIRVGTSVNVSIQVRANPAAILVPPQAVIGAGTSALILVRNPKSGASEPRPIELGGSDAANVEVVSGLRAGETIAWAAEQRSPSGH